MAVSFVYRLFHYLRVVQVSDSSTTERALADSIAAFDAELARKLPAEVLEAVHARPSPEIVADEAGRGAPRVGAAAPPFSLPDARGGQVSLQKQLACGPVVLTFYRGAWCPYCDLALRAYQEVLPHIRALGANLVAISPQTPDESLTTAEKKNLAFAVLSDAGNTVARQYGLIFEVSTALDAIHKAFGIDLVEIERRHLERVTGAPRLSSSAGTAASRSRSWMPIIACVSNPRSSCVSSKPWCAARWCRRVARNITTARRTKARPRHEPWVATESCLSS